DPEGTMISYLEAWQKGDYAAMYSYLTPLSQDAISLEDFARRYEDVRITATLERVETELLAAAALQPESAEATYRVTFHTRLVGSFSREITGGLKLIQGTWRIAWADGLILPELAGGNTLLMDIKVPARANIYDRNGNALAAQGDAVVLGIVPGQITDEDGLLRELSRLLGRRAEAIKEAYQYARPDWYVPIGEASAGEVQARLETLSGLGGLVMQTIHTRYYTAGGLAPQVLGYVAYIPADQLDEYKALGYRVDEKVGIYGLEKWGEPYLSGKRGGTLRVASPAGQIVASLAASETQPAQAIYTTLDRDFQRQVQEALGDFRAAAVVLDKNTGEVLAMASSPGYDPNLFDPLNRNNTLLSQAFNDPGRPFLNRATQGQYPLGSVFKIITMAAALDSGRYTRDTVYNCGAYFTEDGFNMADWTVEYQFPPTGPVDLVGGLTRSCNPYFWHIGLDLFLSGDPFRVPNMARAFGLGQATGIDAVAESTGQIPDPDWKLQTKGEAWQAGDSVNSATGQGDVQVTPLQVARFIAAIGNDGTLYQPRLISRIVPPDGNPSFQFQPELQGTLPINHDTLIAIQDGMIGVVTARNGTAANRMRGLGVRAAGKTGTAEDPPRLPHSWFAGYTFDDRPDRPDIAVVVIVENQGEGSAYAAPIFRRIVEDYFYGSPQTLYWWESAFGVTATPEPGGTPVPGDTPTPASP
ncbi:MAG: hypothetical protein HY784_13405, partial [Chloroflexi bacterium]|nr:hypothetical protein [Chloroflexota bacterium]